MRRRKTRWWEGVRGISGEWNPLTPTKMLAVPARGSRNVHVQRQAGYLCFLSADGNGSNTCKISSINKCWGLIAWSALAQKLAGCSLFQLWLGLDQGVGNLAPSVCWGGLQWPPSIFLLEKYLLCTNWSPSWQPWCSGCDSLTQVWVLHGKKGRWHRHTARGWRPQWSGHLIF